MSNSSSTYLCETGFSALVLIITKQGNRLDVNSDLMIALTKTERRINQLVLNLQSRVSHHYYLLLFYDITFIILISTYKIV